jgi:hypothetical protein
MRKVALLALCVLEFFVLPGCSPRVQISIAEDSKTDILILSQALPETIKLIKSFDALGQGVAALDVETVKASFIKAGFNQVYAKSSDGISLEIDANAEKAGEVFSVFHNAIDYEPSSFQITLSPDTIPEILALVPSNTRDYLDFIMAPILTGEKMTENEYKAMITSVYGQTIGRELADSVFELVIVAPKAISSYKAPPVARVQQRGSRVTFTLPLTAVLVENGNAVYRVEWN